MNLQKCFSCIFISFDDGPRLNIGLTISCAISLMNIFIGIGLFLIPRYLKRAPNCDLRKEEKENDININAEEGAKNQVELF